MKRWHVLVCLGLAATASLALIPIETLIPTEMPIWQVRLAVMAQPAILLMISVAVGERFAGPAALSAPLIDALLAGGSISQVLRRQIAPGLLIGLAAASLLVAYSIWIGPHVSPEGDLAAFASFEMPLATKLLYGGLGEEIITRWGLVSVFAVMGLAITRQSSRLALWVMTTAILLAAITFAAAHLPLLFLINTSPPPWVVGAVLAGNTLPGVGFGWLFWKHGLEAAMLAHITAHIASTICMSWLSAL